MTYVWVWCLAMVFRTWMLCIRLYNCMKRNEIQLQDFFQKFTDKNTIWATTWQNQQSDCAPSEDSYQPGHPPSLIRVFAVRMKKAWVLSYPLSAQRRLWSDWADARFVGFVMSRLISFLSNDSFSVYCISSVRVRSLFEPEHGKTYKMACVPSKDSDQGLISFCCALNG